MLVDNLFNRKHTYQLIKHLSAHNTYKLIYSELSLERRERRERKERKEISGPASGRRVSARADAGAPCFFMQAIVEATTAPPTPALVAERWKFLQLRRLWLKLPGGEGSFSLTSPALDEALRQRFRKVKKEVGYGGGSKVLWAPAKRGFRWSGTAVW
ncbi:hypothetical protein YC2023_005592 [Brassica napus]